MKDFFGLNEVKIQYSSLELIRDTGELIKPYSARFWLASLARLLGDIVWLYPPLALASIVTFLTTYTTGASLDALWLTLGLWALAIVARSVLQFLAKFYGYQVAEKVAIDASLKTVEHMFALDMFWHERENSGNKIKRIQNASAGLDRIIRIWFENIIEIVVNFVGILIIIAQLDLTVLGFLVLFLVTYFAISFVMTRRAGAASYIVNQQEEEVSGLMFEAINNVRTLKIMAMARAYFNIVLKETDILFKKIQTRVFRYQSRNSVLNFWAEGFHIGILAFIAFGILTGHYELGFLVLFNGYFGNIWQSVDELSNSMQNFITSKFSIARMRDTLDEPLGIDDETDKAMFSPDWQTITFKDVSFSYGTNEVLHGISLTVKRGERVGIVGLSGGGKSTLFKLLLKEREEFTGDILFDDVSIKNILKNDYFRYVSAVLQDTEVFNFSLRDNVTIADVSKKEDDTLLMQAVSTAHVSDFLGKLPEGVDTLIGEKGVKLSGGERQRLGIARAIFKQPDLLLLDEATSHLDSESEEKIQDSLHQFFEKVTAIVIAHRLSTIREMDRILVIESGRLVESGSFDALQKKKGRFYELWEKQKL